MTIVNLIPMPRILARKRATLVRRWAWGGAVYSATVIAGYGSAAATWDHEPSGAQTRLDAETKANLDRRQTDKTLMERLARERTVLVANRAVGDQPNWSLLLALMSRSAEATVVLESCRVEPALDSSSSVPTKSAEDLRPDHEPARYTVQLRGASRTQEAVSAFALRLEQAALFTRVELVESRRDTVGGGKSEAVRFRLDCTLETREVPR